MKYIPFFGFPLSFSGVSGTKFWSFFSDKPHFPQFLYFSVPLPNNRTGLGWGAAYIIRIEFLFEDLLILFISLIIIILCIIR